MLDESILIRDDGPNRVRLYRRPDTPKFYFEVFVERKRVKRGSTGSDHLETARQFALDAFETILSKHRRGLPLRTTALKTLVARHLADRDLEVERGEITAATVDQARIVLTNYFLPWCEEAGIKNLSDISDQRIREYVEWRRSYRPEGTTITYMREGKVVTAKRPRNHLRGLTGVSLVKQLDPIRRFFRWSVDLGHIEDRDQPRMPRIRTGSRRRNSPLGGDAPGRWFSPEQAIALIKTAAADAREAHRKAVHALQAYGPQYRERFASSDGGRRNSQRAMQAEYFFYWLVLMLVAGTRPIELRNLSWNQLGIHRYATGYVGVTFDVTSKKRTRRLLLDRDFLEIFYRMAGLANSKPLKDISRAGFPEDPRLTSDPQMISEALLFHDLTTQSRERDTPVFPVRSFKTRFHGLLKRSGVSSEGHSPYSLRHTHINFRLLQGDNMHDVSIKVGNSVKMIEQYYNALTPVIYGEREHGQRIGASIEARTKEFEEVLIKEAIAEVQKPIREFNSMTDTPSIHGQVHVDFSLYNAMMSLAKADDNSGN